MPYLDTHVSSQPETVAPRVGQHITIRANTHTQKELFD